MTVTTSKTYLSGKYSNHPAMGSKIALSSGTKGTRKVDHPILMVGLRRHHDVRADSSPQLNVFLFLALRSVAVTCTMEGFGGTRETCNPWWQALHFLSHKSTTKQGRVRLQQSQAYGSHKSRRVQSRAFLRESWAARTVCLPRFRENHKSSQIFECGKVDFFQLRFYLPNPSCFPFLQSHQQQTAGKEIHHWICKQSDSLWIYNCADHVAMVMPFSCNTSQLNNLSNGITLEIEYGYQKWCFFEKKKLTFQTLYGYFGVCEIFQKKNG